jgi:4-amino-4-deoxy-L-arabinose transferase-like glycosyltransferase
MKPAHIKPVFMAALISLFNILIFITLFSMRSLDDNRLTSWKWVFADINPANVFFGLISGLVAAYALSRTSFLERTPLFLFPVSFFFATVFWGTPEVIVDASRYFTQAKHLKEYGILYFLREWGKDITVWTDLPLVPFLYGLIFKTLGEIRLCIQIFTTLLFSMTVLITYEIGKTLWDEKMGFYAGLFMLGSPYLFTQVPLMLVDVPTMFFLTFSIFAVIKALDRGGIWLLCISSVALILAFFSKYSNWLWLSVMIPIFIVHLRMAPRMTVKRGSVIVAMSLVLAGITILFYNDVISEQIRLLMSYQKPGLRRWGESFTSTLLFQTHPFITLAALYSIYVAIRKKDIKYTVISCLVGIVIFTQIKRIRYIVPLFPMLALMASHGIKDIGNTEVKRFIVFCTIISSLVLAYFGFFPFTKKISTVNLKNAGNFINSLDVAQIEVVTLPQRKSIINPAISVPLFDVYTNKKISYNETHEFPKDPERLKKSSLRFTWQYVNPAYYAIENQTIKKSGAIVVISQEPNQAIPGHLARKITKYNHSKKFGTSSGRFRFRTIVTVYYN